MAHVLCGLKIPADSKVLIGPQTGDDAGVYKISEDLALIQSLDFFTPIVDDPFDFGRIAAANALSDIYAMGGEPKTAMNIVAFPAKKMDLQILREILAGGMEILARTGTALLGGHSVQDDELKYGLSVTGFVHPQKIIANKGLRSGDSLILTKPLGTGIINTAIKAGFAQPETITAAVDLMTTLNQSASWVMKSFPVSACTDVTGFGLMGHLAEMVQESSTNIMKISAGHGGTELFCFSGSSGYFVRPPNFWRSGNGHCLLPGQRAFVPLAGSGSCPSFHYRTGGSGTRTYCGFLILIHHQNSKTLSLYFTKNPLRRIPDPSSKVICGVSVSNIWDFPGDQRVSDMGWKSTGYNSQWLVGYGTWR